MNKGTHIRLVLVDDHGMFRSGVKSELVGDGAFEVVGEAGDVESSIAVIRQTRPDVVLLDVHLPGGTGHGRCCSSPTNGANPDGLAGRTGLRAGHSSWLLRELPSRSGQSRQRSAH